MYDILQLNDMLVPELLDIAEQLKISNTKKLDKQELIYKILDNQAIQQGALVTDVVTTTDKPKRKKTVKATTANSTEEAEVMSGEIEKPEKPAKQVKIAKQANTPKPAEPVLQSEKIEAPAAKANNTNNTEAVADDGKKRIKKAKKYE